MSTATMTKKKPKKAKGRLATDPSRQIPEQNEILNSTGVISKALDGDAVQKLKSRIDAVIKAKDRTDPWNTEKIEKHDQELADLHEQLSLVELQAMPIPIQPKCLDKFMEQDVEISDIKTTGNHREIYDEAETIRLARSMQSLRLQQRIGVRDMGDGSYELIWGSRRLAAANRLGWQAIPAKIFTAALTSADVEILRTVENFGQKGITHIERAIAVARTIEAVENTWNSGRAESDQLTSAIAAAGGLHAYVGQQLGFDAKWVKDNAYVSKLGGKARALLAAHRLDIGHARELAKLGDPEAADSVAQWVARDKDGLGGKTIEWCRKRVAEQLRSLRSVPWRLDVAFGAGKPGCTGQACQTCKFNSRSDPDLFGGALADEPAAGVCTNGACYAAKQAIVEKDLEKGIAKVARKSDFQITETSMAQFVPLHVKPASAARKAKKELQASDSDAAGHAGKSKPQQTPEEIAKNKLDVALGKWESKASGVVLKAAKTDPARTLLMMVLSDGAALPHLWGGDREKRTAEGLETIAEAVVDGGQALMQKLVDNKHWSPGFFDNVPAEWLAPFISSWNLKMPAMPRLEDFLPKQPGLTDVREIPVLECGDRVRSLNDPSYAGKIEEFGIVVEIGIRKHMGKVRIEWDFESPKTRRRDGWKKIDDVQRADEKESPKESPVDWIARMDACQTAEEARELFGEHEEAIAALQRSLELIPLCGRINERNTTGFTVVKAREWKSAVAMAKKVDPAAGEELQRLIDQGIGIHGERWGKLHDAEIDSMRPAASCRVCGCTEEDCSECIKRTGEPCSRVEPDLCSACYPIVNFNFDETSREELEAYVEELTKVIDGYVGNLRAVAIRQRAKANKQLKDMPKEPPAKKPDAKPTKNAGGDADGPLSLAAAGVTVQEVVASIGSILPPNNASPEDCKAHQSKIGEPMRIRKELFVVVETSGSDNAIICTLAALDASGPSDVWMEWGETWSSNKKFKQDPPEAMPLVGVICKAPGGRKMVFGHPRRSLKIEIPKGIWLDALAANQADHDVRRTRRSQG